MTWLGYVGLAFGVTFTIVFVHYLVQTPLRRNRRRRVQVCWETLTKALTEHRAGRLSDQELEHLAYWLNEWMADDGLTYLDIQHRLREVWK